jgi:putative ABC transport system permease protein
MFKNYFKTAWRNLLRNKVYSIIAILGLAIGLAISILLFWGINDEMTYDQSWSDAKNIYRVNATVKLGENTYDTWTGTPVPVTAYASKNLPEVEAATRYSMEDRLLIINGNDHVFETGPAFTEPSFFSFFHVKFLVGNAQTALGDMKNVVLSRDAAIKYFGNVNNAVGKVLLITENKEPFTVSAVIENMPEKSSVRLNMILSLDMVRKTFGGNGDWKTIDEDWGNFSATSFLRLRPGASPASVQTQLDKAHLQYNQYTKQGDVKYILQPLNMLRLYNPDMSPGEISGLKLFLLVGILTLLIAVINYVNLSTARATKRAKEVGLRRVVGANRKQLLLQFVTEFILIFMASLIIACLLLPAITPLYQNISGKHYAIDYWQLSTFKIIGWVALGTITLASLYPAWILSSFNPTQVLKSNFNKSAKGGLLRKGLVIAQFSFSIILVISTIVVFKQLRFIQEKNLGYNRDNVFTMDLSSKMVDHLDALMRELKNNKAITDVSFSSNNILYSSGATDGFTWPGKPEHSTAHIAPMNVTPDFTSFMQMQFAQGSGFTGTPADSGYFLVNESAVKEMNLSNPVGTPIELWGQKGQIKGVLKDFNNRTLKEAIQPAIFRISHPGWGGKLYVRIKHDNAKEAVAATEKICKSFDETLPFAYKFLDEDFDAMYRRESQTGGLVAFFGSIAILLSCLGLFGLAVFTAERRTKEVGIRKVLGASVQSISLLISKEFTWLVIIANVIAWPIAWYSMHKWIEGFVYRTTISWWIFLAAACVALLLAIITVSSQAIKAAITNPVKSLRAE